MKRMVRPATTHRKRRASIQFLRACITTAQAHGRRCCKPWLALRRCAPRLERGEKEMIEIDPPEGRPWPLRALLLLALGALAGLLIHLLTEHASAWDDPVRLAAAPFVGGGFLTFAFSLERQRWTWSVLFALAVGLVSGLVAWSNGPWR